MGWVGSGHGKWTHGQLGSVVMARSSSVESTIRNMYTPGFVGDATFSQNVAARMGSIYSKRVGRGQHRSVEGYQQRRVAASDRRQD